MIVTESEFIEDQYELYGEDYINDLMDRGYVAINIPSVGWRWVPSNSPIRLTAHA